jgi:Uma2 family endonuclease
MKKNQPCNTLTSDQKVFIPATNWIIYPDVTVYCGEPEFYLDSSSVISNPLLIVEVLSAETAEYDRTTKFENYCSIPSLREYVLVAQDRPFIEAFYLYDPETSLWKISRATGLDAAIHLLSLDCPLKLKDIYRMVKFPQNVDLTK